MSEYLFISTVPGLEASSNGSSLRRDEEVLGHIGKRLSFTNILEILPYSSIKTDLSPGSVLKYFHCEHDPKLLKVTSPSLSLLIY